MLPAQASIGTGGGRHAWGSPFSHHCSSLQNFSNRDVMLTQEKCVPFSAKPEYKTRIVTAPTQVDARLVPLQDIPGRNKVYK
jgi:hypothetical protein